MTIDTTALSTGCPTVHSQISNGQSQLVHPVVKCDEAFSIQLPSVQSGSIEK